MEGGQTLTSSGGVDADALDILNIKIPMATTTYKSVDVQPGDSSEILFVCIKSDVHNGVKYKFTDDTGDSSQVTLDTDHIITSAELAKLFGKAPNQIKFINGNTTTDANIDIVVARKAIA